jgi:hypothetical protein
MKRLTFIWILFVTTLLHAQSNEAKQNVLGRIARNPSGPNFAVVAAKLRQGIDTATAYKQLDTLLARPYGDMFWMYSCAGLYHATQDVLRPEYKQRVRWCWKHFTPYRGDTENHFLMYYGSLLLMSQAWPDLVDSEWFMGKSSHEIYAESKGYLDHWIDETVRYGTTEWDSPRYGYYYITCLAILAEYTQDARLKHRFGMMLEYTLADYAAEYLNGNYCGAHSRVSNQCAIDPKSTEMTSYGEYFFQDSVVHLQPDLAFAALSHFECPKIIRQIATDRSEPYVHTEQKRGRQMIRYLDKWSASDSTYDSEFHAPVYKYDYMTKDYCLGSMQGGIVQPIQQQSWSLVFNSDKPHNIITGLHPYVSAEELGMFFPEYPSFQLERISNVKQGYTSENKWVGGSPYERIYQDKNVLVALYDLPDSAKYPEYDLFIPDEMIDIGSLREQRMENPNFDQDSLGWGWIDAATKKAEMPHYLYHDVWIYFLKPFRWTREREGWRLRSKTSQGGYVVWIDPPDWFVMGEPECDSITIKNGKIELQCRLARGEKEILTKEDRTLINLNRRRLISDWLFKSKFLESKRGSAVLTMRYKGEKRVLDFRK